MAGLQFLWFYINEARPTRRCQNCYSQQQISTLSEVKLSDNIISSVTMELSTEKLLPKLNHQDRQVNTEGARHRETSSNEVRSYFEASSEQLPTVQKNSFGTFGRRILFFIGRRRGCMSQWRGFDENIREEGYQLLISLGMVCKHILFFDQLHIYWLVT